MGSAELPVCLLRGSGSIRHRRQEAGRPGLRCLKVMHRHTHERKWGNICLELWLSATIFSLLNHGDWELNQGTKWNAIRNRWDARWSLQKKNIDRQAVRKMGWSDSTGNSSEIRGNVAQKPRIKVWRQRHCHRDPEFPPDPVLEPMAMWHCTNNTDLGSQLGLIFRGSTSCWCALKVLTVNRAK